MGVWQRLSEEAHEARARGDFAGALVKLGQALGTPALDAMALATLHKQIAEIHDYQDHLVEAEHHYLRALEAIGERDPYGNQATLSLHHTTERFYASIGEEKKAAAMQERLQAILERTEDMGRLTKVVQFGEGEPNARGRRFEMRARFRPSDEALETHRRSSLPASDWCLFAQYFHSKGWPQLALPMYEYAYHHDIGRFTRLHPAVATTLANAAELHRELGNLQTAEAMEAEAQGIRAQLREADRAALESEDPGRLAANYLRLGLWAELASDFVLATSLYRLAMAHEPSDRATWYFIHNNLGYSLVQRGRYAEAEGFCRRAIVIDGSRHNAHKNLGLALKGLGRPYEAAVSLMESARSCQGQDPRPYIELERLVEGCPALVEGHPEVREWVDEARRLVLGEPATG